MIQNWRQPTRNMPAALVAWNLVALLSLLLVECQSGRNGSSLRLTGKATGDLAPIPISITSSKVTSTSTTSTIAIATRSKLSLNGKFQVADHFFFLIFSILGCNDSRIVHPNPACRMTRARVYSYIYSGS